MRNFDDAPFLVIWELTQACDLACVHCRARAIGSRNPLELSTEEGFRLLEEVRSFGDPLMVFTGGDPLKRPDLFSLLEKSVSALQHAQEIGMPTQMNTTVTKHNVGRLGEIAKLVEHSGAKLWSVFFLVATGRASALQDLTATEYEEVFAFLYDLSKTVPFDIKTTEAQHYRRYVAQRRKAEGTGGNTSTKSAAEVIQRQAGINDGSGFVFVSHTGEIFPSGFLPIGAGNVRGDSLAAVYRHCPLFRTLRNADNLQGKCGDCEYRNLCGGSRSRSYAITGNLLAEEPRCVYEPMTLGATRKPTQLETRSKEVFLPGVLRQVAGQ